MRSRTYKLFVEAMIDLRPIQCSYDNQPRTICPIILGHKSGEEKALNYQTAGGTSKGRLPQWKCLELAKITDAKIVDAPWRSGGEHRQQQHCVKEVDLDVNADSPYNPKRSLVKLRAAKQRRMARGSGT